MTSAARPTWAPAKGGNEQGGTRTFGPSRKQSSRDIASHTTLKLRKDGQDTQEELQKRNIHEELEDREMRHKDGRDRSRRASPLLLEGTTNNKSDKSEDSDDSYDSNEDDDDEEDEEKALAAELDRMKREKAEEKRRKEEQRLAEELKIRGNILLNIPAIGIFSVKRKWNDDVVFRNQARGETKTPKRFINDTLRNPFHRKFMDRTFM